MIIPILVPFRIKYIRNSRLVERESRSIDNKDRHMRLFDVCEFAIIFFRKKKRIIKKRFFVSIVKVPKVLHPTIATFRHTAAWNLGGIRYCSGTHDLSSCCSTYAGRRELRRGLSKEGRVVCVGTYFGYRKRPVPFERGTCMRTETFRDGLDWLAAFARFGVFKSWRRCHKVSE